MKLRRTQLVTRIERRAMLRGTLSVGALTLLAGCDFTDDDVVQRLLATMSTWNDRMQAALFSPTKLAPTYREDQVVHDFRYNAFFAPEDAPDLKEADYRLQLSGMIADKKAWTVEALRALPQRSDITRHVCVEGWSMIGKWGGVPLGDFLRRVGADTTAKYVGFECADGYYESMDMATALHPQTLMALTFADQTIPRKFGFPFKIRVPTNRFAGGFWSDRGYNWFSGS
jgi:DMSO/TMAO reductase YedYZ molybdopterin-dependent catalytic subunit